MRDRQVSAIKRTLYLTRICGLQELQSVKPKSDSPIPNCYYAPNRARHSAASIPRFACT
jgi:hypothetical protein